jgi:flagellar motility protein MotE (MotC chaperone)
MTKKSAQTSLLSVVILALVAFAGLRAANLWLGFSAAGAQEKVKTALIAPVASAMAADAIENHADAPLPEIPPSETERRILEKLAARRASLDLREEELEAREAVIEAAERRLDERISAYENEREALLALRAEKEEAETEEVESLVSAYERMKAKDAAAIFNDLDEDILVPVASGMRTQALAGVLGEMTPEKARNLTRLLAERNKIEEGVPAQMPAEETQAEETQAEEPAENAPVEQ